VVRGEKMKTVGEKVLGPMGEVICGFANNNAGMQKVSKVTVEGDLSKADDDPDAWQGLDLAGKVGGTVANLLR
jgi:hypothetical protein